MTNLRGIREPTASWQGHDDFLSSNANNHPSSTFSIAKSSHLNAHTDLNVTATTWFSPSSAASIKRLVLSFLAHTIPADIR